MNMSTVFHIHIYGCGVTLCMHISLFIYNWYLEEILVIFSSAAEISSYSRCWVSVRRLSRDLLASFSLASINQSHFICESLNHSQIVSKGICTVKEKTNWPLLSKRETTVAWQNSPVGRNLEQRPDSGYRILAVRPRSILRHRPLWIATRTPSRKGVPQSNPIKCLNPI